MIKDILLVDDEAGIRRVLGISLADIGYRVHTAKDGKQGFLSFKKIQPKIVLTDIKMPGMDGIELLMAIKKMSPDTQVIMLTGHGDMNLAIKSLKHGATDFITKPIHDEALEIALKRAGERFVMKQQLKDYTENLERLVAEKTQQLVNAERMAAVGETVAGLSHAIKNIAGGLEGGMFVLEKGLELDDKTSLDNGWKMIRSNVHKIKTFSLDLLDFAKSDRITYEPCNPLTPIKEVYELIRSKAAKNRIDTRLVIPDKLPAICMDADGIYNCLLNLAVNAIDACLETDPCKNGQAITLTARGLNGNGVEYRVGDNCCGIPPEFEDKIFQRFFSTKGSRGTGIGLMLTKKIVDRHNGTIALNTQKGKGAEFIIRIMDKTDG